MSAYITDKSLVDEMVNIAQHNDVSFYDHLFDNEKTTLLNPRTQYNEIGQKLVDEMVKSVSYRYPDDDLTNLPGALNAWWILPYLHTLRHRQSTTIEGIKLIQNYDYQTCEHPEYQLSSVKHFCDSLISSLISNLPGYSEAKWGWDVPEPESKMIRLSQL